MILSAWRGPVCRRIDRLLWTKPEIATERIDRVIASGAAFRLCACRSRGHGSSGPFRRALSERGLLWAVGLSRTPERLSRRRCPGLPRRKGWKAPANTTSPDQPPVAASLRSVIGRRKWQRVSWRPGTKASKPGHVSSRPAVSALQMAISTACSIIVCRGMPGDERSVRRRTPVDWRAKIPCGRTYRPMPASRCSPPRSRQMGL